MVSAILTGRRKRRRLLLFGLFLVTLALVFTIYRSGHAIQLLVKSAPSNDSISRDDSTVRANEVSEFWRSLHNKIMTNNPNCERQPDIVLPAQLNVPFDPNHAHPRPDLLWIYDADIQKLKSSHAQFVGNIESSKLQLPYILNTTGIVTTASDALLPILVISLRMLRRTGCQLFAEVFLEQRSRSNDYICSIILDNLDAKCIYFTDIFARAGTKNMFASYQHKPLAILFSSFQNVLLLDSDAWPVRNPEFLFKSVAFVNTGMIMWPDFWYAAESPFYFDVANISVPDIPSLQDRAATESGAIMYDKTRHAPSIMLAAYYNIYGPTYYYILQNQGAPGQGDKQTFPNAALALQESFHCVGTAVRALGRQDSAGQFIGSAMVQWWDGDSSVHMEADIVRATTKPTPKPLFVHFNAPKPDPYTIFNNPSSTQSLAPPVDSNGTSVRCWTDHINAAVELFGLDLELVFWNEVKDTICGDLMGLGAWMMLTGNEKGAVSSKQERQKMLEKDRYACERVKRHVREVFGI